MKLCPPRIEPLELRVAPAIIVTLSGGGVSFTDDVNGAAANSLELRVAANGLLEYQINSAGFSTDLNTTVAGTQSAMVSALSFISVSLGSEDDNLTLNNANGLIAPSGDVFYDGGTGANGFAISGTSAADTFTLSGSAVNLNGEVFSGVNVSSLTITGAVADSISLNGAVALSGSLNLAAGTVTIAASATAAGVNISADSLAINASLTSAANNRMVIKAVTANRSINLGTEVGGFLSLTAAEIGLLTAGTLEIGATTAFQMTLSVPITYAATTLRILAGSVIESSSGDTVPLITVPNLRIDAPQGIGNFNIIEVDVTNIAFGTTAGGTVQIEDVNSVTLADVDGVTESRVDGNIRLVSRAGSLTVADTFVLANGDVTLQANDLPTPGQTITIQSGGAVFGDSIFLGAGDDVQIPGGQLSASDEVSIRVDFVSQDPGVGGQFFNIGSMSGASLLLVGGSDADSYFFGSVNSQLPPAVRISGNGGNDSLTLNDSVNGTGDLIVFTPTGPTSGLIETNPDIPSFDDPVSIEWFGMAGISYNTPSGADQIRVAPNFGQNPTSITINGGSSGINMRDRLFIDASAVTTTPQVSVTGNGSGVWSSGGSGFSVIGFFGMELVDARARYTMNMGSIQGGNDGQIDLVEIRHRPIAGEFEIELSTLSTKFNAVADGVLALSIIGSNDNDFLRFQDEGFDLPRFLEPANPQPFVNPSFLESEPTLSFAGLSLAGGNGTDTVQIQLAASRDINFYPELLTLTVGGQFAASMSSIEAVQVAGRGGTVTYNGSAAVEAEYVLSDNGSPGDRYNRLVGQFQTTPFDFAGFTTVIARASQGSQTFRVNGPLDVSTLFFSEAVLTNVVLDGGGTLGQDTAGDTFIVSDLAANIAATLVGGAGDDVFSIASLAAGGSTRISGGTGNDTLSFTNATAGVSLALDEVNFARGLLGGNLTLLEPVESFVGSPFADSIRVRAESFTRNIEGGAGTDTLLVDARGQFASIHRSSGIAGTISFPHFAAVGFHATERVVLENSASSGGFSGSGPGAFGAATGYDVPKGGVSVAAGDLNGDGFSDLVVASGKGGISVLLGAGDGLFAPGVPLASGGKVPIDVLIGDLDGDSIKDLFVLHSGSSNVAYLRGTGGGAFADPQFVLTGKKPVAMASNDLNSDGRPDLAVASAAGQLSLILGKSDGSGFEEALHQPSGGKGPVDLAIADLNGDGAPDLAVLHAKSNRLTVHAGDGSGQFVADPFQRVVSKNAVALAIADLNHDGRLDAVVGYNVNRFVGVLLNSGSATDVFGTQLRIGTPTANAGRALALGDFNGDGHDDLALGTANGSALRVLLGAGTGLFAAARDFDLGPDPIRAASALAIEDLNGDGALDAILLHPKSGEISIMLRV